MTDELAGDSIGVKSLGPPPRSVPLKLRVQLLTNLGLVIGGVIFGIGSIVGVAVILAANPVSAWRVAMHAREAPGQLVSVEPTSYEENDEKVYRCQYTFQTPDGVEHPGLCYMRGQEVASPPPQAQHDPKQRPRVVVEYDPSHPGSSRIKGMRVGSMAWYFAVFLLLPGLAGLLTTLGGLQFGRSRIRLLAEGELAGGTLISCTITPNSEDAKEIPFAEFRQSWLAKEPPAKDGGSMLEPELPEIKVPTALPGVPPYLPMMARGFMSFWTCGVMAIVSFGTLVMVAGIILIMLEKSPLVANGRPTAKAGMVLGFLAFLVIWLVMGAFMLRSGRRMKDTLSGKLRPGEINPHPSIRCTFEFRPPGGEVVRVQETIRFNSRLGSESTEPILYDPTQPKRAIPLNGLFPAVRVSPFGDWEAAKGPAPWLRAALVAACVVAGPPIGWFAWHWS